MCIFYNHEGTSMIKYIREYLRVSSDFYNSCVNSCKYRVVSQVNTLLLQYETICAIVILTKYVAKAAAFRKLT